jgi:hypothetical protein
VHQACRSICGDSHAEYVPAAYAPPLTGIKIASLSFPNSAEITQEHEKTEPLRIRLLRIIF